MTKDKKIANTLLYLVAGIWTVITIFPLFTTFICSVKDNNGINLGMFAMPEKWLFSNYLAAINNAHMLKAVFNSLVVSLSSTALVVVIGMFAAYILSRRGYSWLRFIYLLFIVGVMVPVHSTIIPISSLASTFHAKNSYIFLILVYSAFNVSQAVFLFTGYLNGVSRELDEAATIDGCDDFRLLFTILFPVCMPIIVTVSILTFIFGYSELIFAMCLISDELKYTISRAMLSFYGAYQVSLGPVFASIIIAIVPMIAIYVFFHEKVQSGFLTGAVKG